MKFRILKFNSCTLDVSGEAVDEAGGQPSSGKTFFTIMLTKFSGVARGVAGVAEATPIFQFLFNRFGQKISVKKSYLLQATTISKTYLPPWHNGF